MRFGTDGIRGIVDAGIDENLAFLVGLAVSTAFCNLQERDSPPLSFLIGMDTRPSSPKLLAAAKAGLIKGGAGVTELGILPSPALSHLVRAHNHSGGIMITASHNPPEYNGIKVFGHNGLKLSESLELEIDSLISQFLNKTSTPLEDKKAILRQKNALNSIPFFTDKNEDACEEYIKYLAEIIGSLDGLKIIADCGYGALYDICGRFFSKVNASITTINDKKEGKKINCGCGALYPSALIPLTKTSFDVGFAFDGDGDRLSVVYKGRVVCGDSVLFALSELIPSDTVVGTVLANSALEKRLALKNKRLLRTPVGDKHILRLMCERGYSLGGEQSGHYIIHPHSATADGLLAAGFIAKKIQRDGLEELRLVPQKSISRYASESRLNSSDVQALIAASRERLYGNGRLIIRMSGTEPKIRLMVESENQSLVNDIINSFNNIL